MTQHSQKHSSGRPVAGHKRQRSRLASICTHVTPPARALPHTAHAAAAWLAGHAPAQRARPHAPALHLSHAGAHSVPGGAGAMASQSHKHLAKASVTRAALAAARCHSRRGAPRSSAAQYAPNMHRAAHMGLACLACAHMPQRSRAVARAQAAGRHARTHTHTHKHTRWRPH